MEDKIMKTIKNILPLVVILALGACNTTRNTATYDDVYYNPKTDKTTKAPVYSQPSSNTSSDSKDAGYNSNQGQTLKAEDSIPSSANSDYNNSRQSTTESYSDENGNTYVTNNYYDDYYDYSYAARMRRFYEPSYGYSYYDDYYTNMYWYSYNPMDWGVSIYLGYHWVSPFFYMGYSPWWHYSSWYMWDPWYSPYYSYYPWYHHGWGYGNGYWDGYYDGLYSDYYYNSYDGNSRHYGPMSSRTTTGSDSRPVRNFAQKYEDARKGTIATDNKSVYNENDANRTKTATSGKTGVNSINSTGKTEGQGNVTPKPGNNNVVPGQGNAGKYNSGVNPEPGKVSANKNVAPGNSQGTTSGNGNVNPPQQKPSSGNAAPVNTDKNKPQPAANSEKVGQKGAPVNRADNNVAAPAQKPNNRGAQQGQGDVTPRKYSNPDYSQPKSNDNFNTR
ncbi:MAG: hypothetical protein PHD97_10455, partial [Bacteroidales bacterium]|nr:hypothetical protein [Bacteroidales bacterium]